MCFWKNLQGVVEVGHVREEAQWGYGTLTRDTMKKRSKGGPMKVTAEGVDHTSELSWSMDRTEGRIRKLECLYPPPHPMVIG